MRKTNSFKQYSSNSYFTDTFTLINIVYFLTVAVQPGISEPTQPNIVILLIDDLGFNDLSLTGSKQARTPTIDDLARSGTVLTRYYTLPVCTPSRGSLMSSKYAIRIGMQNGNCKHSAPCGLPLKETILPEVLKDMGYETHAVGKWHLGFYTEDHLPTNRGFDSFFGLYGGQIDYYDHTSADEDLVGLDFHFDIKGKPSQPGWDYFGNYTTDLYTDRAKEVIKSRDKSKPFFLYFAHQGVHTPIEGPDEYMYQSEGIYDPERRRYLTQIASVDASIKDFLEFLKDQNVYDKTIIVFTSDNGGPHTPDSRSSNYPLRGAKMYNWEGGVRTLAFIVGPNIPSEKTYNELFHVTDWMPTLVEAVGGDSGTLPGDIDGVSQWGELSGKSKSKKQGAPRTELLVNIQQSHSEGAIISGKYKLHRAPNGIHGSIRIGEIEDGWYFYEGPFGETDKDRIFFKDGWQLPVINCTEPKKYKKCDMREGVDQKCLFNIVDDPCEYNNIADQHPEIVDELTAKLDKFKESMVDPMLSDTDPASDPALHDNVWEPWMKNE